MTVLARSAARPYHTVRLRTGHDPVGTGSAEGMAELAHSLLLLRGTHVHVSLYRITFLDHDRADASALAALAFGREGMTGRLADGGFALLLVNTPTDEVLTDGRVAARLERAMASLRLEGTVEIAACHSFASDVGDLDDMLMHLSLTPPVRRHLSPHAFSAA